MNKINRLVLAFLLFLPFSHVQADIDSDLASDIPFEIVIKNGLQAGLPMSVVLVKIFSSTPKSQHLSIVSAAIFISPSDAPLVVRTAIRAGADPEEVVTEAVALAPLERKEISKAAIAAGADPMDVTLATAAGLARSGMTLSKGGALGTLPPPSAGPVLEAGIVPPINIPRINGGGSPPVTPPNTGVSQS